MYSSPCSICTVLRYTNSSYLSITLTTRGGDHENTAWLKDWLLGAEVSCFRQLRYKWFASSSQLPAAHGRQSDSSSSFFGLLVNLFGLYALHLRRRRCSAMFVLHLHGDVSTHPHVYLSCGIVCFHFKPSILSDFSLPVLSTGSLFYLPRR